MLGYELAVEDVLNEEKQVVGKVYRGTHYQSLRGQLDGRIHKLANPVESKEQKIMSTVTTGGGYGRLIGSSAPSAALSVSTALSSSHQPWT